MHTTVRNMGEHYSVMCQKEWIEEEDAQTVGLNPTMTANVMLTWCPSPCSLKYLPPLSFWLLQSVLYKMLASWKVVCKYFCISTGSFYWWLYILMCCQVWSWRTGCVRGTPVRSCSHLARVSGPHIRNGLFSVWSRKGPTYRWVLIRMWIRNYEIKKSNSSLCRQKGLSIFLKQ